MVSYTAGWYVVTCAEPIIVAYIVILFLFQILADRKYRFEDILMHQAQIFEVNVWITPFMV